MELDSPADQTLEWTEPQPASVPSPSYAPFFLAIGVTMLLWGIVTSPAMSAVGLALLMWALWMWLAAVAKDWKE